MFFVDFYIVLVFGTLCGPLDLSAVLVISSLLIVIRSVWYTLIQFSQIRLSSCVILLLRYFLANMASSKLLRSMRHLTSILLLLSSTIVALQVSPNSPCAAACLDSADLDRSDPNSSNTRNSDISCEDADYTNESRGRKFKECMSCLQDSSFSRGAESDLSWFLCK
jgi:hypothetical protein